MFNQLAYLALTLITLGAVACSPTPGNTRASASETTATATGTATAAAGSGAGPGSESGTRIGAPEAALTAPAGAAPQTAPASTRAVSGAIVETMNAGGYAYAQL